MINSTTWVDKSTPHMGWPDLCVFGGMLGASALIGCYFGLFSGRKNSASEYLRGGKSMGIIPVSLSLVASHISGITLLGVPSEIYRYGSQYWAVIISGYFISLTIALVFVPVFVKLNLTSSYQYLELRFNAKVRRMASVLFIISQAVYIPIVIYVPALAFSQVTGISVHLITPVTCFVCIFYTTLGGLRAVVWTDALQTVLMLGACVAVLFLGAHKLGGWGEVWRINEEGGRLEFFNLDPDPLKRHTFWTVFIGIYFIWLSQCGVSQSMVQRYLSVPTKRAAQWSVFWFSWGLAFSKFLSIAAGWLIYANYHQCDPLTTGQVKRPDQMYPFYVLEIAGHIPGFNGVFIAGVFSAALSSMSTGINALSGVIVEDLLADVLPMKVISKEAWLKIAAACTGVVCVLLVFVVEHLGGVLQAGISLGGITSGATLGLFVFGMFFPQANSKGALVGSISSLLGVGFLVFGAQSAIASGSLKHETLPMTTLGCTANLTAVSATQVPSTVLPIFRLSYMYYSLIGTFVVLIVGLPVSKFCGEQPEVHPDLLSSYIHPFLPKKIQLEEREIKPLVTLPIIEPVPT